MKLPALSLQKAAAGLLTGAIAGSLGFGFAETLNAAVQLHAERPWLIFLIPGAALLIQAYRTRAGRTVERGQALLLEEIENPETASPRRLIPSLWLTALLSQGVGASVGREGGAVQLGGAAGSLISHRFPRSRDRISWVQAGMSGGFTGCFGTPLAAALFALEVRTVDRFFGRPSKAGSGLPEAFWGVTGALLARTLIMSFHPPVERPWPKVGLPHAQPIQAALISALLIGCLVIWAWGIPRLWQALKRFLGTLQGGRLLLASSSLTALYFLLDSGLRFRGLSLETLHTFFQRPPRWEDLLGKLSATGLSLAFGFKGGEFIPLGFVGAGTGSLLATALGLHPAPFAAAGFVALFGALAQTPLAMTVLALELFSTGLGSVPGELVFYGGICWLTYLAAPAQGIYSGQRTAPFNGRNPKRPLFLAPWRYGLPPDRYTEKAE
jgi:H+/Cl- antiporter ClcA